jgi:uncharacterized protein (UPF0335 family)
MQALNDAITLEASDLRSKLEVTELENMQYKQLSEELREAYDH